MPRFSADMQDTIGRFENKLRQFGFHRFGAFQWRCTVATGGCGRFSLPEKRLRGKSWNRKIFLEFLFDLDYNYLRSKGLQIQESAGRSVVLGFIGIARTWK